MNKYLPRVVDKEIEELLKIMGAILIEGPKWCGKSTTGEQHAKEILRFQDPDRQKEYEEIKDIRPSFFLEGKKPLMFDEWQRYPVVWDSVRTDVDKTGLKGQYILTGSAKPADNAVMHTGTGRIARVVMRPMSLFESGESNGQVSLRDIVEGKDIKGISNLELEDICVAVVRGGWPEAVKIKSDLKYRIIKEYVNSLVTEEVRFIDGVDRNPEKMRAVLRSLARNISTPVKDSTLVEDTKNLFEQEISRPTLLDYLNTLERLFVIENINATNLNFRSKTVIRTKSKKEFIDPSIATAVLGLSDKDLIRDLNLFGFVFECMAIRDLKIYSNDYDGKISFYRNENGFEIDAILRLDNGKWGAIEIKLGDGKIEEGVKNLLEFKKNVDIEKEGEPAFLMVLTGTKFSYKRPDGVYVVSIGSLKD